MRSINRIKKILCCNKGEGVPLAIAVTMALLLIMLVIGEYFRLNIIAQGVRDCLQDAVISTVTENYAKVYHSAREGYSGGYVPIAENFEESISYGDIYKRLENVLGLSYNNGRYEKYIDNNLEFAVYDLTIEVNNAPLKGGDIHTDRFEIYSYISLEVPINFIGNILPPMKIRIKSSAGYSAVF